MVWNKLWSFHENQHKNGMENGIKKMVHRERKSKLVRLSSLSFGTNALRMMYNILYMFYSEG